MTFIIFFLSFYPYFYLFLSLNALRMTIILKNVKGDPESERLLSEFSEFGYVEGKLINNVTFSPQDNACYWTYRDNDFVAYLGETCVELINPVRISSIKVNQLPDGEHEIQARFNGRMSSTKKISKKVNIPLLDRVRLKALIRQHFLSEILEASKIVRRSREIKVE
jgi:hypothetical protein